MGLTYESCLYLCKVKLYVLGDISSSSDLGNILIIASKNELGLPHLEKECKNDRSQ